MKPHSRGRVRLTGDAPEAPLAIEHGWKPGTVNTRILDAGCGPQLRTNGAAGAVHIALSNSFGFGGNNCVLAFGAARAAAARA